MFDITTMRALNIKCHKYIILTPVCLIIVYRNLFYVLRLLLYISASYEGKIIVNSQDAKYLKMILSHLTLCLFAPSGPP